MRNQKRHTYVVPLGKDAQQLAFVSAEMDERISIYLNIWRFRLSSRAHSGYALVRCLLDAQKMP